MFRKLQTKAIFSLIAAVMMSLILVNVGLAAVWTDQADYAPGSTVTISGDNSDHAGFLPGETVHVDVSGPNGYTASCDGVADASGAWSCQVVLRSDSSAVGDYSYTATGVDSHVSQSGVFSDGQKVGTVSVSAQNPNPVQAGNSATYTITVNRGTGGGSNGAFSTNLSVTTVFPTGVTYSFSPNSVSFSSTENEKQSTLTIVTTNAVPVGSTAFTVKALTSTNDYATSDGTLAISAPAKLNQSITFSPLANKIYGDTNFTVSATASSGLTVSFAATGSCNVTGSTVHLTGAGSCMVTASQGGNASYNAAPDVSRTFTIAPKGASVNADAKTKTYGDNNPALTATVTGTVNGDTLNFTLATTAVKFSSVGDYPITVTLGSNPNYTVAKTDSTLTIGPKALTITANSTSKTYGDSITFGGTEFTTEGLVNSDIVTSVTLTSGGADAAAGVAGSPYPITPSAAVGSGLSNYDINYVNGSLTVNKALSITTVSGGGNFTYDGNAHPATVTVTGAGGLSLAPDPVYSGNCSAAPVNVDDTPCTANYTYTGDANHDASSDSAVITITKATSATELTFESSPYVYRGSAFTAAANVTGVGGLDQAVAVVYTGDCTNVTTTDGCTATATFAGDDNHLRSSDTKSITITKASSTTVLTFEAGPYVYRGSAFMATATVTGMGGLNQAVNVVYSGDCTNVTSTDGCTATATFAGDTNHFDSSDSKSITITKADASCTISGYTGTYDGNAHGAAGSCSGIGGESAGSLDLGASFTDVPGGTAHWTLTGNGNYNDQSSDAAIVINKADANITVTLYDVIFDGKAHTAAGTAAGVKGESLSGLDLSGTTHTNPGDYPGDAWTFTDTTGNYNNASGTVHDNIHFATSGMCYGGPGHAILQPINADGSSVWKARNTIPVKFRVCDANGNSIGGSIAAVFDTTLGKSAVPYIYKTTSLTNNVDESAVSNTPDLQFRWDPSAQQWIFNLNTTNLAGGKTYSYHVYLIDGTTIDFTFGLK